MVAKRVARRRNDASEAIPAIALAQSEPSDLGAGWRMIDADGSMKDIEAQVLGALLA